MDLTEKTRAVKQAASKLGFHKVGIAPVEPLPHSEFLEQWLSKGYHGTMAWMAETLKTRINITQLYPPAKSVIVVAHNYYTPHQHSSSPEHGKISRYAWGKDYHKIMKKKLKRLLQELKSLDPQIEGRLTVDTAPVQEKLWAVRAGIGWQGKNTNVLSREMGSWFFLGLLIINQPLQYDQPIADFCGTCNACVEACPTEALQPYVLDARRCISYLTIEHRDRPLPKPFSSKLDNWLFGCDVCQDVCPWNRFARETDETRYQPKDPRFVQPELSFLVNLNEETFDWLFAGTPVRRAKHANFIRNVKAALQNRKTAAHSED